MDSAQRVYGRAGADVRWQRRERPVGQGAQPGGPRVGTVLAFVVLVSLLMWAGLAALVVWIW